MPRVGHPWWKHFCDARFIIMEVDTSVMIILVMSWNTSTTAQVWLSWFYHKIVMDVHAWQKTRPTVTNTYHHRSVFFCSDNSCLKLPHIERQHGIAFLWALWFIMSGQPTLYAIKRNLKNMLPLLFFNMFLFCYSVFSTYSMFLVRKGSKDICSQ